MVQIINLPLFQNAFTESPWFVQGFDILEMTSTTVTLGPGSTRSNSSNFIMQIPGDAPGRAGTYTIDITKQGIGGMFPTVFNLSTLPFGNFFGFPIAVIGDSSGTNPIEMVIMTDFKKLPEGYDSFSFVQIAYLTSSGLLQVQQSGSNGNRLYTFGITQILNNGTANSPTPINLFGFGVPPGKLVKNLYLNYRYTPAVSINEARLRSNLAISGSNVIISKGNTGLQRNNIVIAPGDDGQIYYSLSGVGDDLDLWISGIEIEIPLFLQYAF